LKSLDELPPLSEVRDIEGVADDLFGAVPLMAVVDTEKNEETEETEEVVNGSIEPAGADDAGAEAEIKDSDVKAEDDDLHADGEPATSGAD
jgi:hypothetical protein